LLEPAVLAAAERVAGIEPGAALRALRYSASIEIDPLERFVACW
jgi:hypothetical protein